MVDKVDNITKSTFSTCLALAFPAVYLQNDDERRQFILEVSDPLNGGSP